MTGTVYLVGAGPGAADLLTLRAARVIAAADVILHDALVGADVLALASGAKLYSVGKRANRPSVDQRLICRLLVRMGQRHKIVVRLKGGDPSLFGRASEEIDACAAAGIPVEIVPGISAGFAAAAALGASLTKRAVSRSVTFVTPTMAKGEAESAHWAEAAAAAETAVIYMGALRAEAIVSELACRGVPMSRPVALIEAASTPNEHVIRGALHELPRLALQLGDGPALIIVGEAIAEARQMLRADAA